LETWVLAAKDNNGLWKMGSGFIFPDRYQWWSCYPIVL
jgi:hypothetical protein